MIYQCKMATINWFERFGSIMIQLGFLSKNLRTKLHLNRSTCCFVKDDTLTHIKRMFVPRSRRGYRLLCSLNEI